MNQNPKTTRKKLNMGILFVLFSIPLQAQQLVPTEDKALINIVVTDMKKKPLSGEIVLLTAKKDKKVYRGQTDKAGKMSILLRRRHV